MDESLPSWPSYAKSSNQVQELCDTIRSVPACSSLNAIQQLMKPALALALAQGEK
jgi:hypothetical protein